MGLGEDKSILVCDSISSDEFSWDAMWNICDQLYIKWQILDSW